jgi:hypothetical protein
MSWFYSGSSMKSLGELDRLVNNVLLAEDFSAQELHGFSATQESQRIDDWEDLPETEDPFCANDGWRESSVCIRVPGEDALQAQPEHLAPEFKVSQIFHRSLTEIIRATFQSAEALTYHLIPFKLYARKPQSNSHPESHTTDSPLEGNNIEHIYSEIYNSDAMIAEYERINIQMASPPSDLPDVVPPLTPATASTMPSTTSRMSSTASSDTNSTVTGTLPGQPQPDIENVIAAIMLYSDSTHLASFGNAALWPAYLFFGNMSKYMRGKPSKLAAHHIAYLPSVCLFV